MEFYRGNQVVAVAEKANGNETVGNVWLETGIFTKENTLGEVLTWAKKTGCTGKLILTIPRPDIDPLYERRIIARKRSKEDWKMDWNKINEAIECHEKHNTTMSLRGGSITYSIDYERFDDEEPPTGRKVAFLNKNGRDHELEEARKIFKPGQVLTVKEIYVGTYSSTVEFVELPGERFNTVMFRDA